MQIMLFKNGNSFIQMANSTIFFSLELKDNAYEHLTYMIMQLQLFIISIY